MNASLNSEEFAAAYTRGFRLTCGFLASRGFSGSTVEEAAQAAWARGWERRSQLRVPERLTVWVNSIALNLVLSEMRKTKKLIALEECPTPKVAPASAAAIDAKAMLDTLSSGDKRLVVLQAVHGLTTEEIGQACTLSPVNTRVRLHRVIKKLRTRVAAGIVRTNNGAGRARIGPESIVADPRRSPGTIPCGRTVSFKS